VKMQVLQEVTLCHLASGWLRS